MDEKIENARAERKPAVTAETVTDEQIRELRDTGDLKLWIICSIALDETPEDNPVKDRADLIAKSRARCAEILNHKQGKKG